MFHSHHPPRTAAAQSGSRPARSRRGLFAVGLVALLTLAACGGKQSPAAQNTPAPTTAPSGSVAPSGGGDGADCTAPAGQPTIATGNSTGVYYVLGGAMAQVISANTPMKATAAETGASVQNIQQLVGGTYDIAFSLADSAADAVNGTGAFDAPQKVQALGKIYSNYTQVVVRKDSGITSIADMKGKRISTGSPKSGTEVIATRLLKAAGLDIDKDLSAQRLELGKSVDGMKDGSLDGLIWSGGLPTPALTDLFTSQKDAIEFVDITPLLPEMQKINPVYAQGAIPAATYSLAADTPTIVVPNLLLVRDDMPAATACALTKAIWGHQDDLVKVHPSAKELDPKAAQATDPVPLAAGAAQALKELAGS